MRIPLRTSGHLIPLISIPYNTSCMLPYLLICFPYSQVACLRQRQLPQRRIQKGARSTKGQEYATGLYSTLLSGPAADYRHQGKAISMHMSQKPRKTRHLIAPDAAERRRGVQAIGTAPCGGAAEANGDAAGASGGGPDSDQAHIQTLHARAPRRLRTRPTTLIGGGEQRRSRLPPRRPRLGCGRTRTDAALRFCCCTPRPSSLERPSQAQSGRILMLRLDRTKICGGGAPPTQCRTWTAARDSPAGSSAGASGGGPV